ncbi:unnamed protein product [Trichogramma brassicae]|uniref:Uncharacterized protein n=1 Tax=Trichogramma brassicae TaxID=86971 RepID=A0A6H5I330_9HYME|nr:unnamed protein product [Trichogramma brassicae]
MCVAQSSRSYYALSLTRDIKWPNAESLYFITIKSLRHLLYIIMYTYKLTRQYNIWLQRCSRLMTQERKLLIPQQSQSISETQSFLPHDYLAQQQMHHQQLSLRPITPIPYVQSRFAQYCRIQACRARVPSFMNALETCARMCFCIGASNERSVSEIKLHTYTALARTFERASFAAATAAAAAAAYLDDKIDPRLRLAKYCESKNLKAPVYNDRSTSKGFLASVAAVQCRLHKVSPIDFNDAMVERLKELAKPTDKFYMKVIDDRTELTVVEFYIRTESNYLASLNDTLALEPQISPRDNNNNPNNRPNKDKMPKSILKSPEIPKIGGYIDVHVSMAAHPGSFTVQPLDSAVQLQAIEVKLHTVSPKLLHDEIRTLPKKTIKLLKKTVKVLKKRLITPKKRLITPEKRLMLPKKMLKLLKKGLIEAGPADAVADPIAEPEAKPVANPEADANADPEAFLNALKKFKRKENSMTPRTSITTGTMKQGRKTKSKPVYSSANRSFSSNKRVVKRHLPEDKLKAIECVLIHGQTKASVAHTYKVPESTLRSWCKRALQVALENKKNLKAQVGDESSASSARSESPLNNPLTHPVACGSTINEEDIEVAIILEVSPRVIHIISSQADINEKNIEGDTVLHYYGADPNARQYDDRTPLHLAVYHKDSTLINGIMDGDSERQYYNLTINGDRIRYPLHKILRLPDIEETWIMDYLEDLPPYVDLEEKDADGNYPLTLACQRHSALVMKALMNAGANPKCQHVDGGSLLHMFSLKKWVENHDEDELKRKICMLLRAGVRVDQLDDNGMTALTVAAMNDSPTMAKLLLCYGADVDYIDWELKTPLHYAIESYSFTTANCLISAGADPNIKRDGETVLHMACDLPEVGGDLLVLLGTKGAYLDETDEIDGATPILKAAKHGALEYAQILVALGANVYARDYRGNSIIDLVDEKMDRNFFLFFWGFFHLLRLVGTPNIEHDLIVKSANEKMEKSQLGVPSLLLQCLDDVVKTMKIAFLFANFSYYQYVGLTENLIADLYLDWKLDETILTREPAVMGNPKMRYVVLNAYERGRFRASIRAAAFAAFKKLLRYPELSYLCFYCITNYLFNRDLMNVIAATDVRNRPSDYARQLRIEKEIKTGKEDNIRYLEIIIYTHTKYYIKMEKLKTTLCERITNQGQAEEIDVRERFHLTMLLLVVTLQTMKEYAWHVNRLAVLLPDCILLLFAELLVDWHPYMREDDWSSGARARADSHARYVGAELFFLSKLRRRSHAENFSPSSSGIRVPEKRKDAPRAACAGAEKRWNRLRDEYEARYSPRPPRRSPLVWLAAEVGSPSKGALVERALYESSSGLLWPASKPADLVLVYVCLFFFVSGRSGAATIASPSI